MSPRLLAGNTNSTGTPVRACSFSLAQRCSPTPRGMAALSRPHALIAVDGQPGSHFSQDLARIVVYVLAATSRSTAMGIIWTIVIGFIAGVIAKFLMPGKNEPAGFILTTILGIVGAILATYLGQALGWYGPNEGAGFIGAIVGAVIVLAIWGFISNRRTTP